MYYKLTFFVLFAALENRSISLAQSPASKPMFEIYEDNDFLNFLGHGTDRYYTNGTKLAIHYFKKKRKNRLPDNLLISFRADSLKRYNWGLMQTMFTPENIAKENLNKDDWPYAGALFFTHGVYSVNEKKTTSIRSEFFIGVLGPWSFAAETQIFLHNRIGDEGPKGWNWQINNYPILNYNILIEPKLFSNRYIDIIGEAETNIGSLMNQLRTGLKIRIGKRNNYYNPVAKGSQFYLQYSLYGGYMLYNAYLEGGFFDRDRYSDALLRGYRLSTNEIENAYIENQVGAYLMHKKIGFSYTQKYRTRQTKNTQSHSVGNISIYLLW